MKAMSCPNCSAPAQPATGQQTYRCPYCQTSFATGLAPEPPPSALASAPRIVIIATERDDHSHRHSMAPHVTASGVSWITWFIVMIVIVGASGGGWRVFSRRHAFALGSAWDGSRPFQCSGNEEVSVENVHAELNAGTAVSVSGNCHFTCTDCTIKAQTVIEAGGNGNVLIVNGTVVGSDTLVDASGNARVNISGNVTASGAVKESANAKVSAPKTTTAPSAAPQTSAPQAVSPSPSPAKPAAAPKPAVKPAVSASSKTGAAASAKK